MNKGKTYIVFLFLCFFVCFHSFDISNLPSYLSQYVNFVLFYRQTSSGIKRSRLASNSIHGSMQLMNSMNKTIEQNGNEIQYVPNPFTDRKQKNGNIDSTSRQLKNPNELRQSLSSSPNQLSLTHNSLSILSSSKTTQHHNSSLSQSALKQPFSKPKSVSNQKSAASQKLVSNQKSVSSQKPVSNQKPISKQKSVSSQNHTPPTQLRNNHTKYPPYYITINSTIDKISFNKTYTHPKNPSKISFFPWDDDGIDYSATCSKLISTIKRFSGPIIVNSGFRGGLGHKFISFFQAIILALILRRPLYCILTLSFSYM